MKLELYFPFWDDPVQNEYIGYFSEDGGVLDVIFRNYDWNYVQVRSQNYRASDPVALIDGDELKIFSDVRSYIISEGTFTQIHRNNTPDWNALLGNQVDHSSDDPETLKWINEGFNPEEEDN